MLLRSIVIMQSLQLLSFSTIGLQDAVQGPNEFHALLRGNAPTVKAEPGNQGMMQIRYLHQPQ